MKTSAIRASKIKDTRFNIRATDTEKALVEQAAAASHTTSSRFMLQAALREAEDVLAAQTKFVLPPDKYNKFVALLDRPAREIPALKRAARRPRPFSDR